MTDGYKSMTEIFRKDMELLNLEQVKTFKQLT